MENFNQILTLFTEHEGISLNSNIFETGLLNILVVIIFLFVVGRDFLASLLEERKVAIIKNVQNAEDRLNEAQKRLNEAQKKFNQANLIIGEIKQTTLLTKKALLDSEIFNAKKDLKIHFDRALITFRSKEQQIFLEIKQQIISLVLKQTVIRVQKTFKPKKRATAFITDRINDLEGNFL